MNTRKLGTTLFSAVILLSVGYAAIAQKQVNPPFKGAAVPRPRQNSGVAAAPQGRQPGDFLCIIAPDVMQYYLKLEKEQVAKIAPKTKRVREEFVKLQGMTGEADRAKLPAQIMLLQQLTKSSDKEIEDILTDAQKKRTDTMFEEIRKFSLLGIDRDAIAQVKLTDKQKKDLTTLADEFRKKQAEIKQDEMKTERPRLAKEYRGKASALLTDEQKATNAKVHAESQLNPKAGG